MPHCATARNAPHLDIERWESLDPAIAKRRRANLSLGREATGEDVGELVASRLGLRSRDDWGAGSCVRRN